MGVGVCWGSLRGPLRQYFSFSQIKEIAGAAGLAVQLLGHLQQRQGPRSASKPQLIDELDLLFADKSTEDQDRITAAAIHEMLRRAHPLQLQELEEQLSSVLAAHGWGFLSGEAYPLPPLGRPADMGLPPTRTVDTRAMVATSTGINAMPTPLREAAPRESRRHARLVLVGGRSYQIGGIAWGTHPPWRFIGTNDVPLTRERFLALPLDERQELGAQVQAYIDSLGGGARLDPIGLASEGGPVTSGGPLGASAFNTSPFNTSAFNPPEYSGAVGGAAVNTYVVDASPAATSTAAFGTGYHEGEDEHRDAVGNVLTEADIADGGSPILDTDGDLILDMNGNPILHNESAVPVAPISAPIRVAPAQGVTVAGPPFGPPPVIPEPGPALIEPEWVEDRLTLPKRLATNDLWDDGVATLVTAVRADFEDLIEALAGTNFSPAARRAIEKVPALLSGVPDQARVFRMGHAVEHLEALQPVLDEELPEALQVQYRTLAAQFRRLVERFPAWRALTSKAQVNPLTEEQQRQAVPVARELAATLSTEAAAEVADTEIASALMDLADATEAAIAPGRALLDLDLVASVEQIVIKLMRPVVDFWSFCWTEYGAGMLAELKKMPHEAGAGTVKGGMRTLLKIVTVVPTTAFAVHLAAIYPNLSWLPAVVGLLTLIAPSRNN